MPRVIGVYVAYGDETGIVDSVRSVRPWVDRLVLFSAPFDAMPPLEAPDRTVKLFERAADVTPHKIVTLEGPVSETFARNRALRMVGDDDWALVIDADEMLFAEHTDIRRTELGLLLGQIRGGLYSEPVGLSIYSTAVLFHGSAKDMSARDYYRRPIVSSMGFQPRVFRARDAEYRPSARGAPGLFVKDQRCLAVPVRGAVVVNHHVRQTWRGYQADFAWETALAR